VGFRNRAWVARLRVQFPEMPLEICPIIGKKSLDRTKICGILIIRNVQKNENTNEIRIHIRIDS